MTWNAQLVATVFSGVILPIGGWAFGAWRAGKKQIQDKEREILRLREAREREMAKAGEEKHELLKQAVEGLDKAVDRIAGSLHAMELKIAQQYATSLSVAQMEERFFKGLERLEEKLDRFLEGKAE